METINDVLNKIESEVMRANKRAYAYIANLPEEDLDVRIDKAHDIVMDKLTPLQLITMDLEKLQLSTQQHDLTRPFNNVKPIDVTPNQYPFDKNIW
jgi:hypothetical protein